MIHGPIAPDPLRVIALDRVDSTNEELKRRAAAGAAAGTLVWANEQLAGRGRRSRGWVSPPGNLYCSLLLRPACPAYQAMQSSFVTALAVADAIAAVLPTATPVTCKWPNDVLAGGRKVAGILLESAALGDGTLEWLVIGVGVNVASCPPRTDGAYAPASLAGLGAEAVTPRRLLESYGDRFFHWWRIWTVSGFAPVRDAWLDRAHGLGQPVQVRLDTDTLEGVFLTMDENGALVLGQGPARRLVMAGDVFPVGAPMGDANGPVTETGRAASCC